MERKRIYDGFNDLATYELRMDHARNLIKDYTDRIKSGQRHFRHNSVTTTEGYWRKRFITVPSLIEWSPLREKDI